MILCFTFVGNLFLFFSEMDAERRAKNFYIACVVVLLSLLLKQAG